MSAQSSGLRSFAITAEFVAGLIPKLARAKTISKNEAELLTQQLKNGAEIALDIAGVIEKQSTEATADERELQAATKAMLNSPVWPAVFRAGSAEALARVALSAAKAQSQ